MQAFGAGAGAAARRGLEVRCYTRVATAVVNYVIAVVPDVSATLTSAIVLVFAPVIFAVIIVAVAERVASVGVCHDATVIQVNQGRAREAVAVIT